MIDLAWLIGLLFNWIAALLAVGVFVFVFVFFVGMILLLIGEMFG